MLQDAMSVLEQLESLLKSAPLNASTEEILHIC